MCMEEMRKINRQAIADGMVKVGIPCGDGPGPSHEWCWAKRVAPSYARLDNCCVFSDQAAFGDIVEFREQSGEEGGPHELLKAFVRVVSRGSTQYVVAYASVEESRSKSERNREMLTQRFKELRRYCDAMPNSWRPIAVEGMVPGLACVAFPAQVTDDEAEVLMAEYPHLVAD